VARIRQALLEREESIRDLAKLAGDLDEILRDLPLSGLPPSVELASQAHYFVVHDLTGIGTGR